MFWDGVHLYFDSSLTWAIKRASNIPFTHISKHLKSLNSLPLFLEYHLKGTIFYTLNIPVSTYIIEGNLGVKLPTSGKMQQQLWKESNQRASVETTPKYVKRQKSRETLSFPTFCSPGGSKSRLAKATDAQLCGRMRFPKLHAAVVRSTFRTLQPRSTSGS